MSYSILYRSMFVKLSDGRFIPMMEMGDNNVYDVSYGRGKARRSRSWSNINLNHGQKFFTHEDIVKALDTWYNESEQKRDRDRNSDLDWARESAEKASFGYYEAIAVYGKGDTCGTTFRDVRSIVLSGMKNCISLEDAVKKCGLKITYWKKEEGDIALSCWKSEHFETEEEMFKVINEKFGGDEKKFYFAYNENYLTSWCYDMVKAIRSFARGGKNKEKSFIITCKKRDDDRKYYVNLGVTGFSLTENVTEATHFEKYKIGKMSLPYIVFDSFSDVAELKRIYNN